MAKTDGKRMMVDHTAPRMMSVFMSTASKESITYAGVTSICIHCTPTSSVALQNLVIRSVYEDSLTPAENQHFDEMNEEERLIESNTQTAAGVLGFMGDLGIKQRLSKNTTYEAMAIMEERHGLSEGVPADLLNSDQEIDVLLASSVMVAEIPSERFVKSDDDKFTYVPGQASDGSNEEVALPIMEMKEVVMIVSDGNHHCRNDAYTYASISRTSKVVNRRIVAMHARGTKEVNDDGKTVLSVCTGGASENRVHAPGDSSRDVTTPTEKRLGWISRS